jgi:uncharacterized protein YbaR (Trm112 family)
MKHELMDILCCPKCKGDLELMVEKEEEGEIMTGFLKCSSCKIDYSIEDSIPNLLIPE